MGLHPMPEEENEAVDLRLPKSANSPFVELMELQQQCQLASNYAEATRTYMPDSGAPVEILQRCRQFKL